MSEQRIFEVVGLDDFSAFAKHWVQGWSVRDIAETYGWSESTAWRRLSTVLNTLRELGIEPPPRGEGRIAPQSYTLAFAA